MHDLLEQQWLNTASHGAALWGRCAQHSQRPRDYAPEAAPQAEGYGYGQIYGPETPLLKM